MEYSQLKQKLMFSSICGGCPPIAYESRNSGVPLRQSFGYGFSYRDNHNERLVCFNRTVSDHLHDGFHAKRKTHRR